MPTTLLYYTKPFDDTVLGEKLAPDYTFSKHYSEEQHGIVLDTVDGQLRKTGLVLIECGDTLFLLEGTTGIVHQQSGSLLHKCKTELEPGPIETSLSQISRLRAFFKVTEICFCLEKFAIVDDEEKTIVRLQHMFLTHEENTCAILSCSPIRGYQRAFERVQEVLIALEDRYMDGDDPLSILDIEKTSYISSPEINLAPESPILGCSNEIISTFLQIARQNETGIIGDHDTEFLHYYRVSLRKIRSVISLLKGVYSEGDNHDLKNEFSEIMASTGRLRDLDVYLLDRKNYFALVPPSCHQGLELLFDAFLKERGVEHRIVCDILGSKAYKKRIKHLEKAFEDNTFAPGKKADIPALYFASLAIQKRYHKVCAIGRAIDDNTEDATIHELRIQCKKLRYLMELFISLFPKKSVKSLIDELKVLQDNLGRFNDYSVQQERLSLFLHSHPYKGEKGMKIAAAIGALTAMLYLKQGEERDQVVSNLKAFDSPAICELFARVYSHKPEENVLTLGE